MKTGIIIQARMGSSRLPGKVAMRIAGKTMLGHVAKRCAKAKTIDAVIVATSEKPADQAILDYCHKNKILSWAGSEDDVLGRYYEAAEHYRLEHIVRITADSPLVDPGIIDACMKLHLKSRADYTATAWGQKREYPLGLDVRIMTKKALEKAHRKGRSPMDREHVTWYIHRHPGEFKISILPCPEELKRPQYHLAVNTTEELRVIRSIFREMKMKKLVIKAANIVRVMDKRQG